MEIVSKDNVTMSLLESLKASLNEILSPFSEQKRGIVDAGVVESLTIESPNHLICVLLTPFSKEEVVKKKIENLVKAVESTLKREDSLREIFVITTHSQKQENISEKLMGIAKVKHVIAVASGKGGVGKSTVALHLALGLKNLGMDVGILDADIYGPSLARLLSIKEKPESMDGRTMVPIIKFGLSLMSMGFMVDESAPLIWRGPMIQGVINQMLQDVNWGDLDVLVVDLPPGTGDVQLTLSQKACLSGVVIVSTPQDLALIDARKAISMFQKLNVPILGIIENMSTFICPNCLEETEIFSHGGAKAEALKSGINFLGEIPLALKIRLSSDEGVPLNEEGEENQVFRAISQKIKEKLIYNL